MTTRSPAAMLEAAKRRWIVSETALDAKVGCRRAAPAQGSTWFGVMAGLWGGFVALLAASPQSLDDAYAWLRGLALVPELLMWLVTLPWTVAYLVYDSSWAHWLRVVVVVLIALVHLGVSAPRSRR